MTSNPTVFVVDDDPGVRQSIRAIVDSMQLGVECHASAEEFLNGCDRSRAGCLVLDVRMPGMSGIELQERLADGGFSWPVVVITGHGDVPMSVKAMKLGATDFLEKPFPPHELRDAIRRAIDLDSRQREDFSRKLDATARLDKLTPQERNVFDGIVAGKTNKDIAGSLDVSLRTVQSRRASLMEKLNVTSKPDLVRLLHVAHGPHSSAPQSNAFSSSAHQHQQAAEVKSWSDIR